MEADLKARRNMVDSQIRTNDVTDPDLVRALMKVPREAFVAKPQQPLAHSDMPIPTSPERALWRPRDFAKLVDALDPQPGELALVIGAGAGYECAVLSLLCETVIGLDENQELVDTTTERLTVLGYDNVVCETGSLAAGLPDQGPYNVILVNGMVEQMPEAWTAQLAEGGRLGVVVDTGRIGKAQVWTKSGEVAAARNVFDAVVPKFTAFNKPAAFAF